MTAPSEPEPGLVLTLEVLSREECMEHLGSSALGRLGFLVDGEPQVLPVNFVLDGTTIVFRTAEGTVLNQAALQKVAFEIDQIDETNGIGWSVVAQGVAQDIGTAIDTTSERLRRLALVTWAPGHRQRWFRIVTTKITGRRLRPVPA